MADAVLLAIDTALLCLCQVTVVLRHVSLFTVLDGGLALFEMGRLLRSQFSVGDAVSNALLLIRFPSIHLVDPRMSRIDNAWSRTG